MTGKWRHLINTTALTPSATSPSKIRQQLSKIKDQTAAAELKPSPDDCTQAKPSQRRSSSHRIPPRSGMCSDTGASIQSDTIGHN